MSKIRRDKLCQAFPRPHYCRAIGMHQVEIRNVDSSPQDKFKALCGELTHQLENIITVRLYCSIENDP
jgi:hypothetical protein